MPPRRTLILLGCVACASPEPQAAHDPIAASVASRGSLPVRSEGGTPPAPSEAGDPVATTQIAPTVTPLYRVWPRTVSLPRTPGEANAVMHAVFPKYLDDVHQCHPFRGGSSWGEIDELIGGMWKAGQFVPMVEERVLGSFTAPATSEVLYRISITHCTRGLDVYRVFAIFDAADAGYGIGPLKLRFGDALLAGEDWRILAVVAHPGGLSHLLVAHDAWNGDGREGLVDHVRELELARPETAKPEPDPQLDHLRAREEAEWHGVSGVWRTVAAFRDPPPDGCTTYHSADAAEDAGSLVRVESGRCTTR